MEFVGEQFIAAPVDAVWGALFSPNVLRACIPGCQDISGNAESGFEATVVQKVGPIKATFHGRVTFDEISAPASMLLVGEGKGGVAGFAKGNAKVRLFEESDGTRLQYLVNAQVGGKIAMLGGRLINTFVAKMADQFFGTFRGMVSGDLKPSARLSL